MVSPPCHIEFCRGSAQLGRSLLHQFSVTNQLWLGDEFLIVCVVLCQMQALEGWDLT